jgi:hypothetical protein
MSHSSTTSYETLLDELGLIQALAASISRRANSRTISQVFSHINDLIWRTTGDSVASLREAIRCCQEYINRYTPSALSEQSPSLSKEIHDLFDRLDDLATRTARGQ